MSWSLARSSCSPRPGPGPVWSSTVNVVNPVMVNLVAGWPGPPPAPDPRLLSRPVSVMTGSFMDTDFCSAVTVPTLAVSQFEDFVTATPTSGFRDFESSFGGTIKNENEYENDFYDDLTEVRTEFGTIKNENEYENDFYVSHLYSLHSESESNYFHQFLLIKFNKIKQEQIININVLKLPGGLE